MDAIQVSIEANEEQQEILISQMEDLAANGFEQTETHLIAYFNEMDFNSFDVNELLKDLRFTISTIPQQNWNEVWESNFSPVKVGNFCAIRADFHEPVNNVTHEIIITPKMSFGTGHHATTYMMIGQMEDIDFKNRSVFDFGTGTGILAILAEKLGAASVSAVDVDDWSILNARENTERNNCSKIKITLSSSIPQEKFDCILANINRNIILQYLQVLQLSLVPNGKLLLSGLLNSDEEIIVESARTLTMKMARKTERNNWISLLFVNG